MTFIPPPFLRIKKAAAAPVRTLPAAGAILRGEDTAEQMQLL